MRFSYVGQADRAMNERPETEPPAVMGTTSPSSATYRLRRLTCSSVLTPIGLSTSASVRYSRERSSAFGLRRGGRAATFTSLRAADGLDNRGCPGTAEPVNPAAPRASA